MTSQPHMASQSDYLTAFQDNHTIYFFFSFLAILSFISIKIKKKTPPYKTTRNFKNPISIIYPSISTEAQTKAKTKFSFSTMDFNNHVHYESKDEYERVEPEELLEDCWFFGNLLHRSPRMLRSLSDPCSSSNYSQDNLPGQSYEETYESIKKLSVRDDDDEINRPNLIKAPSVPYSLEKRSKRSNRKKSSSKNLVRAPSLPTSLETEELQDEEIEFSMGKLIRQASMNYSDTLPPRTYSSIKGLRRKPELESIKIEGLEETQKSSIDLESEELQGFKDLGFDFDEKDLSPNVMSLIPGLQEKKKIEEDEEKISRRQHLYEKWGAQSYSAPPVPRWVGKRSTEDMKAQIKFWARAVASNVRQEC